MSISLSNPRDNNLYYPSQGTAVDPATIYDSELSIIRPGAFDGWRVGVTGALWGIGGGLTVEAARNGARVAGVDFGDEPAVKSAVNTLRSDGAEIRLQSFDCSHRDQQVASADFLVDQFRGLDLLICNAGVTLRRRFLDTAPEEMDALVEINMKAPWFQISRAIVAMRDNPPDAHGVRGRIAVLSSPHSSGSIAYHTAYAMSKAAIESMGGQLASESIAEKWGIVVIKIIPGWVLTERQIQDELFLQPGRTRQEVMTTFQTAAQTCGCYTIYNPRAFARKVLERCSTADWAECGSVIDLSANHNNSFRGNIMRQQPEGKLDGMVFPLGGVQEKVG